MALEGYTAALTRMAVYEDRSIRQWHWLLPLFLIALVPRLVLLVTKTSQLESWEYDTLARNIVGGIGYTISNFGHNTFAFGDGNLYTFVAAVVYWSVGYQPLALATLQALLASFTAPVIFLIGRRALGVWPAALGGVLAAFHPGLLVYTLKLHPLGLDVLLLALSVLWIRRLDRQPQTGVLAGLAMGMSLMTRPTFFLASCGALLVRWLGIRRVSASLILPVVLALAVAAPWVARNWAVLGRPVFISTSLEDVWKGNNSLASGSSYLPSGRDVFSAAPPELQTRLQMADELQVNDIFANQIVDFVQQEPAEFAALTARKFVYFWSISPQMGMLYPSDWLRLYEMYFATIAGFAIAGSIAILTRGNSDERSLLYTLIAVGLCLSVIHALSYVEGRHRWGIEPLLLLLSARGVFVMAELARRGSGYFRRTRLLAAP